MFRNLVENFTESVRRLRPGKLMVVPLIKEEMLYLISLIKATDRMDSDDM